MGTLDSCPVPPHERDPAKLLERLRRMLGFLSQLDLREAAREVKMLPKFVNCAACGKECRAKEAQRLKNRPQCSECLTDHWDAVMSRYNTN